MLHTTRAVVLHTIQHGDSTVVLKALTEELGVRSFLVRISKKGAGVQAALQPLNRIELVARAKDDQDLLMVRELRVERPFVRIPYDPVRGTVVLFVQEVLYKVLRGEAADVSLYQFVDEVLETIDTSNELRNFPLLFLVRLSEEMGFLPSPPSVGEDRFDLREGEFVRGASKHGHTMAPQLSGHLAALLPLRFKDLPGPSIGATQRRDLLDHLLLFYRMHVEGLSELRSPAILHQVLG